MKSMFFMTLAFSSFAAIAFTNDMGTDTSTTGNSMDSKYSNYGYGIQGNVSKPTYNGSSMDQGQPNYYQGNAPSQGYYGQYNNVPQGQTYYSNQGNVQNSNSVNSSYATNNNDGHQFPNEKNYPKDQYKTENDRHINSKIRNKVTGWFTDNYKDIVIRTSDGIVVIEGFVITKDDQKKLNDELKEIDGVKRIENNTHLKK